jgi:hypothetical protein
MKLPSVLCPLSSVLCLASCESITPETQMILARGATDALHIYVQNRTEDGPDNKQIIDPVHGPNWGVKPLSQK